MLFVLGIFLILHGIAHLPAFAISWRLTTSPEIPYKTTVFMGAVNLGDGGIRAFGLLWLLAMLGFVLTGLAVLFKLAAWPLLLLIVTLFSLVLCVVEWPLSRVGLVLNLFLLVYLLLANVFGWLPTA